MGLDATGIEINGSSIARQERVQDIFHKPSIAESKTLASDYMTICSWKARSGIYRGQRIENILRVEGTAGGCFSSYCKILNELGTKVFAP